MRIGSGAAALCAAVCVQTGTAGAQTRTLMLADVLARARERAPEIVSARLAVDEARARRLGAGLRFQTNPELEGALGSRNGPDARFTDFEVGIGQIVEPGSRREARVAGADAAIARSSAELDETTRMVLRAAAAAYFRALHATERIRLLAATQELASGVHSVAVRRFKAGDIPVLDLNLARASFARVRAEREAAEAGRSVALGELARLLRLDEDIDVAGALTRPADVELPALLRSASQRPELRALEAAVREAEAEVRLGTTYATPDYGLGVRYSREEGDQIVRGGITVTLPVFSRGQELRAVGSARAARLGAELEAARSRVQLEVRSAFDAYRRRLAAIRVLETDAIPGMDENEQLANRSFEVGQIGLPELLLVRREILETRSQYLDVLLEAALARIDLDAGAALLR